MPRSPVPSSASWAVLLCGFAWALGAAPPGLYLRDSGELAGAVFALGVAHETGFSLYCLTAKLVALLPLGEVAFRVSLASALAAALTGLVVFRVASALARGVGAAPAVALVAGGGAAMALHAGLTFGRAAAVAEVYASLALALALGLALVLYAAAGEAWAGHAMALLCGLCFGLHGELRLLVAPASLVVWVRALRRGERWPLFAPALVATGMAVVAYLPLRSGRHPAALWADVGHLGALVSFLQAGRIRAAFADQILTHDGELLWARLVAFASQVEAQLGILLLALALAGLVALARRRRGAAVLFGGVLAVDALYAAWINPMGLDDFQDGVPTALVIAVLAGVGAAAAVRTFARAAPFAAGALAVIAVVPAALSQVDAKGGLDATAPRLVRAALAPLPSRALVLVTSDDLAAGSAYEQLVAGARPDVTVLVRQQWDDRPALRRRLQRVGEIVATPRLLSDGPVALAEREALVRTVWWELGEDPPPPLELGVPLGRVTPMPGAPDVRALLDRTAALTGGADPLVRRRVAQMLDQLGMRRFVAGNAADADALFHTALAADPAYGGAAHNLAVVRAAAGDFAGALALCAALLQREPWRTPSLENAAGYRLVLGDLAGAERDYSRAHRRDGARSEPLVGLARVALRRGDRGAAERWLEEARKRGAKLTLEQLER